MYHCFIQVHNWTEDDVQLYNTFNNYYNVLFVPVDYVSKNNFTSFYTSSLSFVLKIVKLDFIFPYRKNMFNVDILFNDKSSADCFETRTTIEEIVSSVVSNRFNDTMELNLSNFCNDPGLYFKYFRALYFFTLLSMCKYYQCCSYWQYYFNNSTHRPSYGVIWVGLY